MKDLFQISFSVKVEASNLLSKRVADPLVKILEDAVPLVQRAGEALVKELEEGGITNGRSKE